jgi:hypothetical protein
VSAQGSHKLEFGNVLRRQRCGCLPLPPGLLDVDPLRIAQRHLLSDYLAGLFVEMVLELELSRKSVTVDRAAAESAGRTKKTNARDVTSLSNRASRPI